jgi:2-oxo-4-hydroxy-4-carboxy-5-ureidoimidazoline decarboxylase
MPAVTLDQLNFAPRDAFVASLGDVFEHAPWVAEAAFGARPFSTVAALHDVMMAAVRTAPRERQFAFVRGHPELGSRVGRAENLTGASKAEQGSLGLDRLSDEELKSFERLNAAYREKFGFPFIICVRRHTRDSILERMARRLDHGTEAELVAALDEIGLITRLLLVGKVDVPVNPD